MLLQNRQGKTRLSKWYTPYDDESKRKIEGEVHRSVTTRDPNHTNFLEVSSECLERRRNEKQHAWPPTNLFGIARLHV
jgi:hypothetical protein